MTLNDLWGGSIQITETSLKPVYRQMQRIIYEINYNKLQKEGAS